jgi:hypothetical protein
MEHWAFTELSRRQSVTQTSPHQHQLHAHHATHAGDGHAHHPHHHHGHGGSALATSAHATLHCLTGCVVGEVAGLMIGVTLGLGLWPTILLATVLSYMSGMTLGLLPVMKSQGVGWLGALRIIWIGEVVSIGVMELVMNVVDYQMGGMAAQSVASWMFWRGLAIAVPAGFLAAWPVNYWLIKHDLKGGH